MHDLLQTALRALVFALFFGGTWYFLSLRGMWGMGKDVTNAADARASALRNTLIATVVYIIMTLLVF